MTSATKATHARKSRVSWEDLRRTPARTRATLAEDDRPGEASVEGSDPVDRVDIPRPLIQAPRMATTEITKDNVEEILGKDGTVIIDFWASWCAPCKTFAPVFDSAASRHESVVWGKVDTQAQQELAQAFGVEAIPTVMVFRDGILLFEQAGIIPAKGLDDLVDQVSKLDMDDVKKKVEEQKAAHGHEHVHGPGCKH